ncbi:MAG: SH3 domain-containing protein [Bacteroidia bacterium]|nr:SH3 domain-containing protein [Bacteroidia bacterium]
MSISTKGWSIVGFFIFLMIFIKTVVNTFTYIGYNFFFFLDNLFAISTFNPVVVWGIFGLFIGSIIGVIIAIKKFQLSKTLILFPVGFVVILITIMGFVNSPLQHSGTYIPPNIVKTEKPSIERFFYVSNIDANVRSGPSVSNSKLFVLKKGSEVEVIQKGFYDSRNVEWFKIKYNYQQGYMSSKLLNYSRSQN